MNNILYKMPCMQKLDALADAVKDRMNELDLNTYEVANAAKLRGHKIVHGTVWNVINQNVKEVKDATLTALEFGLNMPSGTLRAIARGEAQDLKPIQNARFARIFELYSNLSKDQRDMVEPFLGAFEKTLERFSETDKDGPPVMTIEELKKSRKPHKTAK